MKYSVQEFHGVGTHEDLPEEVRLGIQDCVSSAFGGGITHEDALHHMQGDHVMVVKDGSHILGFSATSIRSPHEVFNHPELPAQSGVYFSGAAVRRDAQSTGIYAMMNRRRLDFGFSHGVDLVYTRTQNPRVEEGITKALHEGIAGTGIRGFELDKIVSVGAYGKMLTDRKPVARSLAYDNLDYDRGDGLIITWRLLK